MPRTPSGAWRATRLRALPVFAVGRRSAEAMAAAGFADVTSADGDVSDLAQLVAARLKPAARLLYLAGEDRSGDSPAICAPAALLSRPR